MNRRHAIKSLATSFGAFLTMPAWASGWNLQTVKLETPFLSAALEDLLTDIVSTIIPDGEKPGAKALGVPAFVQKMVVDCYEKPAQDEFKTGLENIEKKAQMTHNQSFTALTTGQKIEILRGSPEAVETEVISPEDQKQKAFFAQLKNLTIQGYTTSEYVLVNHYKYDMVPGHFYGCISV
jgi:Gluconate 2-dehydrogenase subunit 3